MAEERAIVRPDGAEILDEREKELSTLKVRFLTSLNHEIRTPLSGILGLTDLLMETDLSPVQQEYLNATRLCAEQLFEVLNATLEFSALSANHVKIEEVDFHLGETVRGAVIDQLLRAEAKGLNLYCSLDEDLPEVVTGDAVRIKQLLGHLLSNALKFTERGEVEVKARVVPDGDFDSQSGRVLLEIAVRDTGIGIAKERLGRIWESFEQLDGGLSRSQPGLGLGLAIARQLAALLGGAIHAESEPGAGSTFIFRAPVRVSLEAAHPSARAQSTAGRPVRILVVEDNDVARRVVHHTLTRNSFIADCVDGGSAALTAVAQHMYDLVLMDLQMPGMNGFEATIAIRRVPGYERVPILAFTANSSAEFRKMCDEAGMQGFITKPVQSENLIATIERFVA